MCECANVRSLDFNETELVVIGHPKELSKLGRPIISRPDNVTFSPSKSARNLGVIIDLNFSLSEQLSDISRSCLYHNRDLKRLGGTMERSTARIIAIATIHSKLEYCNFLLLDLPASHLNRLQFVLNLCCPSCHQNLKIWAYLFHS